MKGLPQVTQPGNSNTEIETPLIPAVDMAQSRSALECPPTVACSQELRGKLIWKSVSKHAFFIYEAVS